MPHRAIAGSGGSGETIERMALQDYSSWNLTVSLPPLQRRGAARAVLTGETMSEPPTTVNPERMTRNILGPLF